LGLVSCGFGWSGASLHIWLAGGVTINHLLIWTHVIVFWRRCHCLRDRTRIEKAIRIVKWWRFLNFSLRSFTSQWGNLRCRLFNWLMMDNFCFVLFLSLCINHLFVCFGHFSWFCFIYWVKLILYGAILFFNNIHFLSTLLQGQFIFIIIIIIQLLSF